MKGSFYGQNPIILFLYSNPTSHKMSERQKRIRIQIDVEYQDEINYIIVPNSRTKSYHNDYLDFLIKYEICSQNSQLDCAIYLYDYLTVSQNEVKAHQNYFAIIVVKKEKYMAQVLQYFFMKAKAA